MIHSLIVQNSFDSATAVLDSSGFPINIQSDIPTAISQQSDRLNDINGHELPTTSSLIPPYFNGLKITTSTNKFIFHELDDYILQTVSSRTIRASTETQSGFELAHASAQIKEPVKNIAVDKYRLKKQLTKSIISDFIYPLPSSLSTSSGTEKTSISIVTVTKTKTKRKTVIIKSTTTPTLTFIPVAPITISASSQITEIARLYCPGGYILANITPGNVRYALQIVQDGNLRYQEVLVNSFYGYSPSVNQWIRSDFLNFGDIIYGTLLYRYTAGATIQNVLCQKN